MWTVQPRGDVCTLLELILICLTCELDKRYNDQSLQSSFIRWSQPLIDT